MDFGYENEVLFPFTITADSTPLPVRPRCARNVNWLVCREVCIPGKADLEVKRDVSARPRRQLLVEPDASLVARLANSCRVRCPP